MKTLCLLLLLGCCQITVVEAKELRLVTLSPHLTELVDSAGAIEQLVAVSAYSDYPPQVKQLPIIGDAFQINQELLLLQKPDLVLYWQDNTAPQIISQLQTLNIKAIAISTEHLADIPKAITQISRLTNTKPKPAAGQFLSQIKQIETTHNYGSVLIQISDDPIYTVNQEHWISQAAAICGLTNSFADLPIKSSMVNIESIIMRQPEYIIRFNQWPENSLLKQQTTLPAINKQQIIVIDPDTFVRPTLRLLSATKQLCQTVAQMNRSQTD